MRRRTFITAAATTPFIPRDIHARAAEPDVASDWFFYDDRFNEARRLAVHAAPPARLTPVRGDMTDVWNAHLGRACEQTRLTLRGVTAESFYFCLRVMLSSKTRIDTAATRVNRDLFHWVIRSTARAPGEPLA